MSEVAVRYEGPAEAARDRAMRAMAADVGRMVRRWRATVGRCMTECGAVVVAVELDAVMVACRRAMPGLRPGRSLSVPPAPRYAPTGTDTSPGPWGQPDAARLRDEVARVAQACADMSRQALMIPGLGASRWTDQHERRWRWLASTLFGAAVRAYETLADLDHALGRQQATPAATGSVAVTGPVAVTEDEDEDGIPGWSLTMRGVRGGR